MTNDLKINKNKELFLKILIQIFIQLKIMFRNFFGKREKCDMLIVIDGVSGLANKSPALASFLTDKRKFKYIYFIFFILYVRVKPYGG